MSTFESSTSSSESDHASHATRPSQTESQPQQQQQQQQQTAEQPRIKAVDMKITSESDALNCMVTFLNIAQKRGAFSLDEAAKIYECMLVFTPSK
jgi:hypothetical protein